MNNMTTIRPTSVSGQTPSPKPPGPFHSSVQSLIINAFSLYLLTNTAKIYADWLEEYRLFYEGEFPDKSFPNGRIIMGHIPLTVAAVDVCRSQTFEKNWPLRIVIEEALEGWHTQDSLDHFVDLCLRLLPDPPDQIDARAFHQFFHIKRPFPRWFKEQVRSHDLVSEHDYFSERPQDNSLDAISKRSPRISAGVSMNLAMEAEGSRGARIRRRAISALKGAEEPDKLLLWNA